MSDDPAPDVINETLRRVLALERRLDALARAAEEQLRATRELAERLSTTSMEALLRSAEEIAEMSLRMAQRARRMDRLAPPWEREPEPEPEPDPSAKVAEYMPLILAAMKHLKSGGDLTDLAEALG